eukprot:gene18681-25200_t
MSSNSLQDLTAVYNNFNNMPAHYQSQHELHACKPTRSCLDRPASTENMQFGSPIVDLQPCIDTPRFNAQRISVDTPKTFPRLREPSVSRHKFAASPCVAVCSGFQGFHPCASSDTLSALTSTSTQDTVSYRHRSSAASPNQESENDSATSALRTRTSNDKPTMRNGPMAEARREVALPAAEASSTGMMTRCGPVSQLDADMAKLLMSFGVDTPINTLYNLLGYESQDYNEMVAAHAESKCSHVDTVACYLHNLRVIAEEAAADPEAASEAQQRSIQETYTAKLLDLVQVGQSGSRASAKPTRAQQQQGKQQLQQRVQLQSQFSKAKVDKASRHGGRQQARPVQRGTSGSGAGQMQGFNQNPWSTLDDIQRQLQNLQVSGEHSSRSMAQSIPQQDAGLHSQASLEHIQELLQQLLSHQASTSQEHHHHHQASGTAPSHSGRQDTFRSSQHISYPAAPSPQFAMGSQPHLLPPSNELDLSAIYHSLMMNQSQMQQQGAQPASAQPDLFQHFMQPIQATQFLPQAAFPALNGLHGMSSGDGLLGMSSSMPVQHSHFPAQLQPSELNPLMWPMSSI